MRPSGDSPAHDEDGKQGAMPQAQMGHCHSAKAAEVSVQHRRLDGLQNLFQCKSTWVCFHFLKRITQCTRLTASIKPFSDGVLSISASKTSSDSFRTYSSTDPQLGVRRGKKKKKDKVYS